MMCISDWTPKMECSLSVSSLILPRLVPLMFVQVIFTLLSVLDLKGFIC